MRDLAKLELTYQTRIDCEELIEDVIIHLLDPTTETKNLYSRPLIKVVDDIIKEHEFMFSNIAKRISKTYSHDLARVICDKILIDGKINWGRIATIYAFVAWMIKQRALKFGSSVDEQSQCLAGVIMDMGTFMADKLAPWITKQGGWKTFETAIDDKEDSKERTICKSILILFVSLGLASGLIMIGLQNLM